MQKPTLSWNEKPYGLRSAGPDLMTHAKHLTKFSLLATFITDHPEEVVTADQLNGIMHVFFGSKEYTITRHDYTKTKRTFTVGMLTVTQEDI